MKAFVFSWGLVFIAALFDSYASFIVKLKFNELGKIDYSSIKSILNYLYVFLSSPLLLTALITFVLSPVAWFFALNKLDLSTAYPILVALHLVIVLFFGVAFLGEAFTTNKIIGVSLIAASLFFFYQPA